ncbi:carboxypeptidase-like regulatory domain-containing protein, partial [Patescibacteria group bacterium]|nr:carboxypeptidase-like regulatory domain-containing protein [Patescibacteria group bacterium]
TSTYKVVVSKTGFNTARTYGTGEVATPENMCYARPEQIVLEGQSTPVSFCIDETSVFSVNTLSTWGSDYWADSFQGASKISTSSNVIISGGEVVLATGTEGYLTSGFLMSTSITPTNLIRWDKFSFTDSKPIGTEATYQLYYASGTEWLLIPDSVLMGNSTGFTHSPVDLSGLATTTYSQLKLEGNLSTNSTSSTPFLFDWQVSWIASQLTPVPNVNFHFRGEKTIGLDASSFPVYKYFTATTSDSNGHVNISNLEWDSYAFSMPLGSNLDLVWTDPWPQPISLPPDNFTQAVKLYLEAENSLLVTIQDSETLEPVFAATTTLSNTDLGYQQNLWTDNKGQSYFVPLTAANYTLTVQVLGYYATSTVISISGNETRTIQLVRYD